MRELQSQTKDSFWYSLVESAAAAEVVLNLILPSLVCSRRDGLWQPPPEWLLILLTLAMNLGGTFLEGRVVCNRRTNTPNTQGKKLKAISMSHLIQLCCGRILQGHKAALTDHSLESKGSPPSLRDSGGLQCGSAERGDLLPRSEWKRQWPTSGLELLMVWSHLFIVKYDLRLLGMRERKAVTFSCFFLTSFKI